jgi:hypothetical protein
VRNRDHGICADCNIDTNELDYVLFWMMRSVKTKALLYPIMRACGLSYELTTTEEIHHVIPVESGGGCCGLENLITLCARCHQARHGGRTKRRRT